MPPTPLPLFRGNRFMRESARRTDGRRTEILHLDRWTFSAFKRAYDMSFHLGFAAEEHVLFAKSRRRPCLYFRSGYQIYSECLAATFSPFLPLLTVCLSGFLRGSYQPTDRRCCITKIVKSGSLGNRQTDRARPGLIHYAGIAAADGNWNG